MKRNLEQTLQALRDSGVEFVITMLWDGGVDYGFLRFKDIGTEKEEWENVRTFADLAAAMHTDATKRFPAYRESDAAGDSNGRHSRRDLEQTLLALYDSEINVTIANNGQDDIDFALVSYMEHGEMTAKDWRHVQGFAELAEALHTAAIKKYPDSTYAKRAA